MTAEINLAIADYFFFAEFGEGRDADLVVFVETPNCRNRYSPFEIIERAVAAILFAF